MLTTIFGANWKTSLSAIGAALSAALTFFSQISYDQGPISLIIPPKWKPYVTWVAGASTLVLWIYNGIAQKSKEVTGGTIQQDSNGATSPYKTDLVRATEQVTPKDK